MRDDANNKSNLVVMAIQSKKTKTDYNSKIVNNLMEMIT